MNKNILQIDFRLVSIVLLLIIIGMFLVWRPWTGLEGRTISVQGEATIKAAPDEFVFYPAYEVTAKDSATAISEVSKIGNEVVTKLKNLGVKESDIKTDVTNAKEYEPAFGTETDEVTAQYSITITVADSDLAKKILTYIATTGPIYSVTPQSNFSRELRKKLETQARGKALADAKTKASQTAKELEVRIGRVISVSEPSWGGPVIFDGRGGAEGDTSISTPAPVFLTGEQELSYAVSVVFRLY
jgi:hypothetical protein